MSSPSRAVFDCNVLLQSLLSSRGPAGRLLGLAKSHTLALFVSRYILDELRDVAMRPNVQRKYHLTSEIVERFCAELEGHATFIEIVPHVFDFPRDPDDAHYVDLAVAVGAKLICRGTKICCHSVTPRRRKDATSLPASPRSKS
jgi:putative PIN family toxin of toxin-antitoxin system